MEEETLSFRISEELKNSLKKMADKDGRRDLSSLCRKILQDAVDADAKHVEKEEN